MTEATAEPLTPVLPPTSERRRLPVWARTVAVAGIVAAVAVFPHLDLTTGYRLRFATFLAMWIGLASSWNLIGGYTGYVDFGHAVFYGLGAYNVGMLMVDVGLPFVIALPVGGLGAAVFALLIGTPTLRLRGPYFSIAMLGILVAVREVVRSLPASITGGGGGLSLPVLEAPSYEAFFYIMAAIAGLVVAVSAGLRRSQFGLQLAAIREDELAAGMKGINTAAVKIRIFALSAFFTGLLGGVSAYWFGYLLPQQVFLESYTVQMIMMVLLGGLGTLAGPIIGAVALYVLQQTLWANFVDWHLFSLGVLLVALVYFLPQGVLGAFGHRGAYSVRRLVGSWFGGGEARSP
ncbi:MAG: branched-chain amino acid ABC transporter permease [Acidimicrobiales bacterium]